MKRHPALQDLSRDHHLVLIRMQKVRRALEDASTDVDALVEDLLAFYRSDMAAHFQEEDDLVVPVARRHGGGELRQLANGIFAEHQDFRVRFDELSRSTEDPLATRRILKELEKLLTAHIHDEEAGLFEGVQEALSEEDLYALWQRSHAFRTKNRSPAACGRPPTARPPAPPGKS